LEETIRKFLNNVCLKVGDRVRIIKGTAKGLTGRVIEVGKDVLVTLDNIRVCGTPLVCLCRKDEIELERDS